MRILIHDFAGHAFPIQLSRELAARGHTVAHVYLANLAGPKGRLQPALADSSRLTIHGITLDKDVEKYSPLKRFMSHRKYARVVKKLIGIGNFDVILSGQTPIDVQAELLWHSRKHRIAFVHWVQDVYCRAIEFFLRQRYKALAGPLSFPFQRLERAVAARSDAVVVIAPAFKDLLIGWGISEKKINVLENWAPIDELDRHLQANAWSDKHNLSGKTVFLYSGTLGLKHRPDLLYRLAESLDSRQSTLVIVSEGVGCDLLARQSPVDSLRILGFQSFSDLPLVLASADVLIATLERNASEFAVPSKILSYLCAGRPILLAAPKANLASQIIERSGAGLVTDPDDQEDWLAQAAKLLSDSHLRKSLGERGRSYAERNFDIADISKAFESVLLKATGRDDVSHKQPLEVLIGDPPSSDDMRESIVVRE